MTAEPPHGLIGPPELYQGHEAGRCGNPCTCQCLACRYAEATTPEKIFGNLLDLMGSVQMPAQVPYFNLCFDHRTERAYAPRLLDRVRK